ncbi:class I SAM-dependent methyltransferase [Paenibacillus thalictri]|uniref:Methyltransferase domain-containing protein n=1 Tax=Paenibacillus thalictri TaxID=2527873 RepID=A0A4Q9DFD0_9BACL|nr:class I SAM-dependent methyltransferase [Paenibacillus thalictri]TBL69316.1 methyltransferase domain-containing protein [Paenibacillus thalictri]
MGFVSILSFTHQCIAARVQPGDTVIDATAGNGNDTLFLAKLVGPRGNVYGFDVQEQAIAKTKERLSKELSQTEHIRLFLRSHDEMAEVLPAGSQDQVAAIMFNLGYLPGYDHALITRTDTTVRALDAALLLLRKSGIVTVVVYPGHEGGREEAEAVRDWCGKLPQELYQVLQYQLINQKNNPPYLLAIEKK